MTAPLRRVCATLTLASWMLAALAGQLVWLHVESEHHGHHHAGEHAVSLFGLHASEPGAHEHQISNARCPSLPSPRIPALLPQLVHAPIVFLNPPQLVDRSVAPTPRPRGSPPLRTILLI
jgi:hypothetical protein